MTIEQYREAADFIRHKTNGFVPETGVVLGSGLGGFVDCITPQYVIDYHEIPHFPISTVAGHSGKLIFARVDGRPVVVMQGRMHYYEGYSVAQSVLPIRVMKLLGVRRLLLSNAAGGINEGYNVGDIIVIDNHINFIPNPLIGKNIDDFGVRFPDMKYPYDPAMVAAAGRLGYAKTGCYVAITGPSLETAAEIRFFKLIGGDLIGMSTVPEVITARHCSMRVFAVSVVTNVTTKETSHEEVVRQGDLASRRMSELFLNMIRAEE